MSDATIGISQQYIQLNAQLHAERPDYGTSGKQWADTVRKLAKDIKATTILDYGCGKQTLSGSLPDLCIQGFDPAIPELSSKPKPADLVVCTDVLEHVEPQFIEDVLDELTRLTQKVALITVATRPAVKFLADGRNAHLTVQPLSWWKGKFEERFDIHAIQELPGHEFALILRSLIFDGPLTVDFSSPHQPQKLRASQTAQPQKIELTSQLVRNGLSLQFHTPNEMTLWRVKSFETKEPSTVAWLDGLESGKVLFDVGANVGMYTIYAAARGLQVVAFEPESQNFALLNANIALNMLQHRATSYPLALSDNSCLDKLYLSDFSAGGSCHSFAEEVGFDLKPRRSSFTQGSVSMTIDQLVASGSVPAPDYIKIDVDGFEHKVLKGAENTLKRPNLRSIIVELNTNLPEHRDVVNQLSAVGFRHDPIQVSRALRPDGAFKGVGEFIFTREPKADWPYGKTLALKPPASSQARRVMHHVLDRVFSTPVIQQPFPFLVVDDVFPADYYEQILRHFPAQDGAMRSLGETGRVPKDTYKERNCVLFTHDDFDRLNEAQRNFWFDFASWLYSEEFISCFIQKFHHTLQPRIDRIIEAEGQLQLKGDALLVEDHTQYAIGPHTDAPHRLITFLFYMPESNRQKNLGTSVYTPKDPSFTCWGGPHYPHDLFNLHSTVEFLPNRLLAFPKTEHSFHGVEPIMQADVARHLLINNIRVMSKVNH